MSDSSGMNRVTVTLGRDGRVVKRAGGLSDEGIWNGEPIAGSKRSVRDRLGGISNDRSEADNKRQRGESTSNSIDMCLGKDDLRFKLMQKKMSHESLNTMPMRNVDLRDKLSRTSRPSSDSIPMRPLDSAASMRPHVHDPRVTGMTRHPALEARNMNTLGRFSPSRNPMELPASGPTRTCSSWTLENLRQRSPGILRRRSPENLRRISPKGLRRMSPEGYRQRSPVGLRRPSPVGLRRPSPMGLRRSSPVGLRRPSPVGLRRPSPVGLRRGSSASLRQLSPQGFRQQSPPYLRRRSQGGLRRRSPEDSIRRTTIGLRRRSPEDLMRRSPDGLRHRFPDGLRRRSPDAFRARSPERPLRPSAARGHSPQRSREDSPRIQLIRPYDDARSTYARISPERAVRSSPYQTQPSIRAPSIRSMVPVSRYPQAGVPLTVDSFLQSLGLEKYAILFKAEEVHFSFRAIDMNALRQLGDGDLKALGIPMGPRKAILQAVMARTRRPL